MKRKLASVNIIVFILCITLGILYIIIVVHYYSIFFSQLCFVCTLRLNTLYILGSLLVLNQSSAQF